MYSLSDLILSTVTQSNLSNHICGWWIFTAFQLAGGITAQRRQGGGCTALLEVAAAPGYGGNCWVFHQTFSRLASFSPWSPREIWRCRDFSGNSLEMYGLGIFFDWFSGCHVCNRKQMQFGTKSDGTSGQWLLWYRYLCWPKPMLLGLIDTRPFKERSEQTRHWCLFTDCAQRYCRVVMYDSWMCTCRSVYVR